MTLPTAFLSSQEQLFCKRMAQGMSPELAARECGMKKTEIVTLLEKDEIKQTLAVLKHQLAQHMNIEVTTDLLNSMLFEAHSTAATSTEKIAAVRELGKMNGLYAPEKKEIDITSTKKISQLESMTDAELVQRANYQLDLRNPKEIEDVRDGGQQESAEQGLDTAGDSQEKGRPSESDSE